MPGESSALPLASYSGTFTSSIRHWFELNQLAPITVMRTVP